MFSIFSILFKLLLYFQTCLQILISRDNSKKDITFLNNSLKTVKILLYWGISVSIWKYHLWNVKKWDTSWNEKALLENQYSLGSRICLTHGFLWKTFLDNFFQSWLHLLSAISSNHFFSFDRFLLEFEKDSIFWLNPQSNLKRWRFDEIFLSIWNFKLPQCLQFLSSSNSSHILSFWVHSKWSTSKEWLSLNFWFFFLFFWKFSQESFGIWLKGKFLWRFFSYNFQYYFLSNKISSSEKSIFP